MKTLLKQVPTILFLLFTAFTMTSCEDCFCEEGNSEAKEKMLTFYEGDKKVMYSENSRAIGNVFFGMSSEMVKEKLDSINIEVNGVKYHFLPRYSNDKKLIDLYLFSDTILSKNHATVAREFGEILERKYDSMSYKNPNEVDGNIELGNRTRIDDNVVFWGKGCRTYGARYIFLGHQKFEPYQYIGPFNSESKSRIWVWILNKSYYKPFSYEELEESI